MRIVADSSCDLFALNGVDFRIVPLTIYTEEKSFVDDPSLNITEMLDYLENYNDRSYTSCPSIDSWLNAFEGAEEIIVLTVTSALSGSYNSAVNAAEIYREDHPEARISIIDSLSTGAEEALILQKLADMIREGQDFETIDKKIRNYQRNTRLFFSFISLHNLTQNGRVNKTVAAALNILKISVTGTASSEGKISVTGKVRGEKKVLQTLIEEMKKAGYHGGRAIITHVENSEAAMKLKEYVQREFKDAKIDIFPARGLCSYYMERKGIVISCETGM